MHSITLTYIDANDVEVSMSVPERSIDEMCDYFERFLIACGYVFEDGEHIKSVKPESDYFGCSGDILTFNDDKSPFVYNFGGSSSYQDDLINLS